MTSDSVTFHPFDEMREAVACCIQVRIVDLTDIAAEHDLCAVTDARDDRLHFVGREVLRFIDDDELVRDASPTDVCDGLKHKLARRDELIDALLGRLAIWL